MPIETPPATEHINARRLIDNLKTLSPEQIALLSEEARTELQTALLDLTKKIESTTVEEK